MYLRIFVPDRQKNKNKKITEGGMHELKYIVPNCTKYN